MYTGQDIAFIIPTKDRPEKVKNVLNSLAKQNISCRRVMIVDSGQSVKDIVMRFSDRLPVEHYECHPPGQIRQRNMAISLLDDRTPLVGLLDDDIVLEPNALESMISFWNRIDLGTAGVSFNIVNKHSTFPAWAKAVIKTIFPQGRVLCSGYNISIEDVSTDLKTQWLCGGATVWRQEILKKYSNKEISSRWATCEDLIFSYPIGKRFSLYVCADAKVRHEHIYDHKVKMKQRYYGRTVILWRFFFVESHVELSRMFFLLMASAEIAFRLIVGMLSFRKRYFQYAMGQIEGAIIGLKASHCGLNLLSFLNEDTVSNKK